MDTLVVPGMAFDCFLHRWMDSLEVQNHIPACKMVLPVLSRSVYRGSLSAVDTHRRLMVGVLVEQEVVAALDVLAQLAGPHLMYVVSRVPQLVEALGPEGEVGVMVAPSMALRRVPLACLLE